MRNLTDSENADERRRRAGFDDAALREETRRRDVIQIEDIDEMRRHAGIDDIELREEIRRLQVGDYVKLTFVNTTNAFAGETLLVRITSIRGDRFRGKLASADLVKSRQPGSLLAFTAQHIHSIPKQRTRMQRDTE